MKLRRAKNKNPKQLKQPTMQESNQKVKRIAKIRFEKSGYYFIALVAFVLLGFWPTYFSKFINGTADFNFYFHFHALMMSLWILALIVQPILIKKKKVSIHRFIGKLSYVLMPLLFISVILLKHSRIGGQVTEGLGASLWLQTKDLVIIGIMYVVAIKYRHNIQLHARAMIATGIVFIEPALARFLIISVFPEEYGLQAFLITIGLVYALLITLMFLERKQKSGRWIFPLELILYIIFHSLYFLKISFPAWDAFAAWFALLPIT